MGIHSIGDAGVSVPLPTLLTMPPPISSLPCYCFSAIKSIPIRNWVRNVDFVRKGSSLAVRQCNWSTTSSSDEEAMIMTPSNVGNNVIEREHVVEVLRGMRMVPREALLYFAKVKELGFRHCVESYVAMMRILCLWGWERKLDDLLVGIMKCRGEELGFEMFELVESIVEIVEVEGESCLVRVLDGLVKAYASLGMFDEAFDVLFMTRKPNFGPSIRSLNFLMNCLIERGKVDTALSLFQQIINKGLSPNVYMYNLLIKAFCRKGCVDQELRDVVLGMEEAGVRPNEYTFTTWIEGYCLHRRSNDGYNLLKNVRMSGTIQFSSFPYDVLINGFCNEMKLSDAEAVLADMETQGLTLTTYSFRPLIHAYCNRNNYVDAKSLHDEMERKGVKTNCVILSSMIKCLSSMGWISEVLNLFQHHKNSGLFFDEISYNVVVDALCKSGRVDEARDLLVEMEQKKMVPDLLHYSTLIHGYCLQRKLLDAVDLFEKVKGQGLEPDVIAYNILASGFSRHGHSEDALDLISIMRSEGLEPDHSTYNLIIVGLCIAGKVREAENVFYCIEEKCVENYSAMVIGYCAANCTSDAYKLFLWAHEQQILLNRNSCSKLLDNLCTEEETDCAFKLYEMLMSRHDFHCIRMCCKIIDCLCEAGDVKRARLVFDIWLKWGLSADTVMYTIMIGGYFKADYFSEANNLFTDMKRRGVQPDVRTYTVVLDGRLKTALSSMPFAHQKVARNIEARRITTTLLTEMKEAGISPDVFFSKKFTRFVR